MATRFYLTDTAAPFTPAAIRGAFGATGGVTRRLDVSKTGGGARTATAVVVTADAMVLHRAVSDVLQAQTISGTLAAELGGGKFINYGTYGLKLHLYVTVGDTNAVRGTLLANYVQASGTSPFRSDGVCVDLSPAQTLTPVAVSAGDRLVLEIGAYEHASGGGQTLNCYRGTTDGATVGGDLVSGDLSANAAGWIECSATVLTGVTPTTPTPDPGLLFNGFTNGVREHGLGGGTRDVTTIVSEVNALSEYTLLDRRFVSTVLDHYTLKGALTALVGYVPELEVHPLQVEGPDIPELVIETSTVSAVVEQLQLLTGYFCEVRGGYLRMWAPGSEHAPFDLVAGDGHLIGDVTVEPSRSDYANRVIVQQANPDGGFVDNLVVQDDDEIAAHGLWEVVISVEPEMDDDEKLAKAEAFLAQCTVIRKLVTYVTEHDGLRPGQAQHLTLPTRNLDNAFLIVDVDMVAVRAETMRYTVTALEGTVFKPDWREILRGVFAAGGGIIVRGGGIIVRD